MAAGSRSPRYSWWPLGSCWAASGCVARGSCSAPGGPCVLLGAGVTEGPAARCVSTRSRSMRARMCARAIDEAVVDDHAERLGEGVRFPAVVVSATARAAALPTSRLARPRCSVRRMARSSGARRRPPLRGDLLGGAGSCARCRVDQVLPDGHGVAAAAERGDDQLAVGLTRADLRRSTGPLRGDGCGVGALAGRRGRRRVGGHLRRNGRFCRASRRPGSMDAATPKRCPMRPPAPINGCARLDRWAVQRDLRAEPERQPAERALPDGNGGVLAEAAERLEPPCGPRRRRRPPRIAKTAHTWPASQHGLRGLIPTRPSRLLVPEGHTRCRPPWHRPDRRAPGCRCGSLLRDAARCRVDQSPAA